MRSTSCNMLPALIIALSMGSWSAAQERPAAEPAPQVIPTVPPPPPPRDDVVVDDEAAEEVVLADGDDQPVAEELVAQDLTPPTEDLVLVTGDESADPDTVRWPTKRPVPAGQVILAFDDVSVEETLDFVAATTGKVVMPVNLTALRTKKITLHNDEPVDRGIALDMLFTAFRLNDIGVIERPDIVIIGLLDQMLNDVGDIPVLGVDDDVMQRQDRGTLVIKIFAVERTEAAVIGDRIGDMFPDYGSLSVDPVSNQIVMLGDVGLCQQVQHLVNQLDRIWRSGRLRTFRLEYADANEVADNVYDLFQESSTTSGRTTGGNTQRGRTQRPGGATSTTGGENVELRLTVNVQQNSVTVQAEPDVMEELARLIVEEWDLPRPVGTSKLYTLRFSDPLRVRNLLQEILGSGSSATGSSRGGRTGGQGPSGRADVGEAVSGVYRFEAYPDRNALLVLAKTEENFDFLDSIIDAIDQPSDVGLPRIIELKHANAITLSEELNALLAPAGVSQPIPRPDTGLSGEGFSDIEAGGATTAESGGQMGFPWQQGGAANNDEQSPESSLIAKIRIVPIARQNALAVLAPPAFMEAVVDTIERFDRPTRQVMISATIAAVSLTDELKLGLRWGAGVAAGGENSVGLSGNLTGAIDNVLSGLFESPGATFTLGDGTNNIGVVLDALSQLTNVRIVQQPRAFTADNKEAIFFNGKQVPVQTSTSVSSGVTTGGFEYRDIGVMLNVRPRITSHGDVDMTINVEISEVETNTGVGDNPVFARRQVRSEILVQNGQTILIGGLLKEQEGKTKRKVPLLGDIPLLGALFTSVEDSIIHEELIVFVTPVVVDNPSSNSDNYNSGYLQRLQEISLPVEEQIENIEDGDDFVNRRLRDPGADYISGAE